MHVGPTEPREDNGARGACPERHPPRRIESRGRPFGHTLSDLWIVQKSPDVGPHLQPERGHSGRKRDCRQGKSRSDGRTEVVGQEILGQGQGNQQDRQWEAPVHVGPQHRKHRDQRQPPRVDAPGGQEPKGGGDQGNREGLGPGIEVRHSQEESPDRQEDGCSNPGALPSARQVERAYAQGDHHTPNREDRGPTAGPPCAGECHLGQPLLVEPRTAEYREAVGIRAGEHVCGQHLKSCAYVVRQVDGGCAAHQGHEGRDDEGDENPGSVQSQSRARGAPSRLGPSETVGRVHLRRSGRLLHRASHQPMLRGSIRFLALRRGSTVRTYVGLRSYPKGKIEYPWPGLVPILRCCGVSSART